MATIALKNAGTVVLNTEKGGHAVIPKGTPLTHLNYFDGMFMRAEHMRLEQRGLRDLTHVSNQAGGHGVVFGYNTSLINGSIRVGGGLAMDPAGRLVYLPEAIDVSIGDLIANSSAAGFSKSKAGNSMLLDDVVGSRFDECIVNGESEPGTVIDGVNYYIITVGHVEGLCGSEDVFGKLCEEACITSSDRPYLLEGVVIRAEPFPTGLSLPTSGEVKLESVHRRSRIASAYFEYERGLIGNLISADGLSRDVWCQGASLPGSITTGVPVALLARSGAQTLFLDRWIVARERMETPPRRYWAHIMAMRPWNIFLAQVLQFQCQLNNLFQGRDGGPLNDPCEQAHGVINETSVKVDELLKLYQETSRRFIDAGMDPAESEKVLSGLTEVNSRLKANTGLKALPPNRLLISGGIVELPSAGYLPVAPDGRLTVNDQVRRMMGEGVDLRFCAVRPDFVPHALEGAQHMERISLLKGLDDPTGKPEVDILVPDGEIGESTVTVSGTGYEMTLDLSPLAIQLLNRSVGTDADSGDGTVQPPSFMRFMINNEGQFPTLSFGGAARGERLPGGGFAFHYAGAFKNPQVEGPPAFTLIELLRHAGIWLTVEIDRDPFSINRNDSARVSGELTVLAQAVVLRSVLTGNLQVTQSELQPRRQKLVTRLGASITTTATNQANGQSKTQAIRLSDRVDITRAPGGSRPTVSVDFPSPGILDKAQKLFRFSSARQWNSDVDANVNGGFSRINPQQPSGPSFTLVELTQEIPLFASKQKVNPAVLTPANSNHESAITALRAIGNALKDPEFEEIAVRKLFPPPQIETGESQLKATRDWVLFHRRRNKQCGGDTPPEPQLPTRKYRVYIVNLRAESEREILHQGLSTNDGGIITKLNPAPVGVVEFAAGIQTLESPADVIRAEWQSKAPASGEIIYGAVASTAAALDEGAELSRARLASLGNVLSTATPLSDGANNELLQSIPDAAIISAAPHDGVMVLATVPIAVTCHQVWGMRTAVRQDVTSLLQRIAGIGASAVTSLLEARDVKLLGQAVFVEGTNQLVTSDSDDLKQLWHGFGDGEITRALLVSQRPADQSAPSDAEKKQIELYQTQSAAISEAVGTVVAANKVFFRPPEDAGGFQPCPAITILVHIAG